MKIYLKYLLVASFVFIVFGFLPKMAEAATLALSPTSASTAVNGTFTVNIVLDTTGQAVYGVDIYSLRFNPSLLQVVDADAVTAGVQIAAGTLMPNNQYNNVDNVAGTIQFSQTSSTTGTNFNGSGTLATITFRGISTGSSNVTFDFTLNSTTDTNVAVLYTDVLTAVTNGSYTVSAGADATAPSVPTGLTATSTSATQINLSWTASTDPTVGGQTTSGLAGYRVYRGGVQIATTTATTYSNTGLTASTLYTYTVAAYDNAGNASAQSSSASATTRSGADTTAPSVPGGFSATVISQTQVNLSWSASTDPTVGGQTTSGLAGYRVYRGGTQIATTTGTTYSNTGLTAGTSYSYTIASYDNAGNASAQTTAANVTTQSFPDTTGPTVSITNPNGSGQTFSNSMTVSASASDPVIGGQVNSGLFSVSLLIDGAIFASSTSGSISASLDTKSLSNATHTLTATARDNAGNVTTSSSVTFTAYNIENATRFPRKIRLSALESVGSIPANLPATITVIVPLSQTVLSSQSLTPDASGDYTVTFQTSFPQIVSIRVSSPGYLPRLLTNIDTTINSATPISVSSLFAGDFNNDGIINSLDYSQLNSFWNQASSLVDINKDGIINSLDFAVLKNNWNRTGE